jgi:hypothetical protein
MEKNKDKVLSSIIDRSFRFNTLSAKFRIDIKSKDTQLNSRAVLKIINNELLQLSVQPFLGIEALRIEVTPDSVRIIDRMNKNYMIDRYDNIKGLSDIDFNFYNLQALFTNHIFMPGQTTVSKKELRTFRFTQKDNFSTLKTKDSSGLLYSFVTDNNENIISATIEDEYRNNSLIWKYDNFQKVGEQSFPFKMIAQLNAEDATKGLATMTFSNPSINAPLSTEFRIPSEYNRISFSQIIKLLDLK